MMEILPNLYFMRQLGPPVASITSLGPNTRSSYGTASTDHLPNVAINCCHLMYCDLWLILVFEEQQHFRFEITRRPRVCGIDTRMMLVVKVGNRRFKYEPRVYSMPTLYGAIGQ